ncbi:hypothetical protein O2V63_03745 [Modestobacter sp. VKM Ac-2977]|nr:hypothetical protein [Modestobacter sp. VKM Ac-2977]
MTTTPFWAALVGSALGRAVINAMCGYISYRLDHRNRHDDTRRDHYVTMLHRAGRLLPAAA